MIWVFAAVGLALVVVIGLVVVGRETARLAAAARPAVFDLEEAVEFIAERLPPDSQARMSHDDVRWVLRADADLLEEATAGAPEGRYPWSRPPADAAAEEPEPVPGATVDELGQVVEDEHTVDADHAVARILAEADRAGRDVADEDVAAVLDARLEYLEAIGAVGGQAETRPWEGDGPA